MRSMMLTLSLGLSATLLAGGCEKLVDDAIDDELLDQAREDAIKACKAIESEVVACDANEELGACVRMLSAVKTRDAEECCDKVGNYAFCDALDAPPDAASSGGSADAGSAQG